MQRLRGMKIAQVFGRAGWWVLRGETTGVSSQGVAGHADQLGQPLGDLQLLPHCSQLRPAQVSHLRRLQHESVIWGPSEEKIMGSGL